MAKFRVVTGHVSHEESGRRIYQSPSAELICRSGNLITSRYLMVLW